MMQPPPAFEPLAQPPEPFEALAQPPVHLSFVREDERIVWVGRPLTRAVWSQVGAIMFVAMAMFLFGGLAALADAIGSFVVVIIGALVLVLVVVPIFNIRRMVYVITEGGVYTRRGIVGERVDQTTYEKITDITFNQDVFGRLLGYGTLQINTAGSVQNALTMIGLSNALAIKRRLEQARSAHLRPHGRPEKSTPSQWIQVADATTFVLRSHVTVVECAGCSRRFKRPNTQQGTIGTCPHCGAQVPWKEVSPGDVAG